MGGSGDGDDPAVTAPVMVSADQRQILEFGGAAVFPVPQVLGMQTPGGPTPRNHACLVAMFQCPAQPAADRSSGPPGPDHSAVAFEPHLAGRIAQQESAIVLGEQRPQMQRCDAVLHVDVHHRGGALPVRAPRHLGIPAGLDHTHEGVDGVGKRRRLLADPVTVGVVAFPVRDQSLTVRRQRGVDRRGLGVRQRG